MWVVFALALWLAVMSVALHLLGDCRLLCAVDLPPTRRGSEHGCVALWVGPAAQEGKEGAIQTPNWGVYWAGAAYFAQ